MLLEEVVLWVFVEATPIASIDCTNLANHNKATKASRILSFQLNSIKIFRTLQETR
jgi:hypothetical protein